MGAPKWNKYTNEELIQMLIDFSNNINKVPSTKDVNKFSEIPTVPIYKRRLKINSWGEILEYCGLCDNYKYKKKHEDNNLKIKESLENLKTISNLLDRAPTHFEFDKMRIGGFSRIILEQNLGLTFNQICRKYIPDKKLIRNYSLTEEDVKIYLFDLKERIGRTPTVDDIRNDTKSNIDYKGIISPFENCNNYSEVLRHIGMDIIMTKRMKTDKELLDEFYELYIVLGGLPTFRDYSGIISARDTYIIRFGSIENICKLLKIDYKNYVLLDNNNNLCFSKAEVKIGNFLIDNNIKFVKEGYYRDYIDGFCSEHRFDWKIRRYFIEYFGMYNPKQSSSVIMKYIEKTNKKIEKLNGFGVIDNCIFIFPSTLKVKSLEEIFKDIL